MKISSQIFPIGFILEVDSANFNPNSKYDGIWQRIKGKVIVGVDENDTDFKTNGKTGGSKKLQQHTHNFSNNWGSKIYSVNEAINNGGSNTVNSCIAYPGAKEIKIENSGDGNSGNLQPYYCVYIWKLVSY